MKLTALAGTAGCRAFAGAAMVFVYLGLVVDPEVFYEHGTYFPAFHYGTGFLRPFLLQPGGVSQYLAAFLAQACAHRWLGAGAFTALALLLGLGYGASLHRAAGWGRLPAAALSVVAVLVVWTRYGFHLDSIVALALAVLGAAVYAHPWTGQLAPVLRAGIGLAASVGGYWVCAGAVHVGILLGAAVEGRRLVRPSALFLVGGFLIPYAIGHLYLGLPPQEALTRLLP